MPAAALMCFTSKDRYRVFTAPRQKNTTIEYGCVLLFLKEQWGSPLPHFPCPSSSSLALQSHPPTIIPSAAVVLSLRMRTHGGCRLTCMSWRRAQRHQRAPHCGKARCLTLPDPPPLTKERKKPSLSAPSLAEEVGKEGAGFSTPRTAVNQGRRITMKLFQSATPQSFFGRGINQSYRYICKLAEQLERGNPMAVWKGKKKHVRCLAIGRRM